MTITDERHGEIGILNLRGNFVGGPAVEVFERAIFNLLRDELTQVILDLSGLKFIDSSGLGAMISAMISVGRKDGALKIAAVQGETQRILKSMNLDRVFDVYDTIDRAEMSFGKKKPA